ncbi:MAG: hypothetical protein JXR84_27530 [Anaerolineae bacterium]|nr:hypothetical protein [Anaerolineae bacterium]
MLQEMFAFQTLTKAVNFLFTEASKILEERRLARQQGHQQAAAPPQIITLEEHPTATTVLQIKITDELAQRKEQAIQGIMDEIAIYQTNYQRLKRRVALEGGIDFAPIAVVNQLFAQEDGILEASKRLDTILQDLMK